MLGEIVEQLRQKAFALTLLVKAVDVEKAVACTHEVRCFAEKSRDAKQTTFHFEQT
jgi:hypothetical protein